MPTMVNDHRGWNSEIKIGFQKISDEEDDKVLLVGMTLSLTTMEMQERVIKMQCGEMGGKVINK